MPQAGGILDQPPWFDLLEEAAYIYRAFKLRDSMGDMVKFSQDHPGEFETVVKLDRMRGLL